MSEQREYGGLDWFRVAAAALVVAIHISPLMGINETADYFLTRILARTAVPFFLMVTGHFVVAKIWQNEKSARQYLAKHIQKMLLLYVVSVVMYLPIGIYAGLYKDLKWTDWLKNLLVDGTFYHLWYLPACIVGILIVCGLRKLLPVKYVLAVTTVLYIVGLFGDSYYGLVEQVPVFNTFYGWIFVVSTYTRNGVFMVPVFLTLGAILGNGNAAGRKSITDITDVRKENAIGLVVTFALMTAEAFVLRHFDVQRHDSMYIMLPPVMIYLYRFLSQWKKKQIPGLRNLALWIYVLHPGVIVAVRGIAKVLHCTGVLVENSMIHYLAVLVLSVIAAAVMCKLTAAVEDMSMYGRKKQRQKGQQWDERQQIGQKQNAGDEICDRAWIELDSRALKHNVEFLKSRLPKSCRLMPAIKAEAYGHGAVLIGRELNRLGVDAFFVDGLEEGVLRRSAGIKGEILFLGYTHPSRFAMLNKYHLTQAAVDYAYALELNRFGKPIHVHVAVDTGMHRLGERSENIERISSIYGMKNLIVDGIFSHLCAADMMQAQEQIYTQWQAEDFEHILEELKKRGCSCKGVHLLSSYGVLHYPQFAGDYARVGIALYGVLSTEEDSTEWAEELQPVLSLKARVASVRTVYTGEYAGYGMKFEAKKDTTVAAVSIGYADGVPRELSGGKGAALVGGKKVPIIGRICMDQLLLDVSDVSDIKAGDEVVLIGVSGKEKITAGEVAAQCHTITNEILSRMGGRLTRVMV